MKPKISSWQLATICLSFAISACDSAGGGRDGRTGNPSTPPGETTYDSKPDRFVFTEQHDADHAEWVYSNQVLIEGINTQVDVAIKNGEYSINGSAYTSKAGKAKDKDSLKVRVFTGDANKETSTAIIQVGETYSEFKVTTRDGDPTTDPTINPVPDVTPDAFIFEEVNDADVTKWIYSNTVEIQGINTSVGISVTNGEYSINSSDFSLAEGVVKNNDKVTVRLYAPSEYSKTVMSSLTVGDKSFDFKVTTRAQPVSDETPDTTPDPFSFPSIVDAPLSKLVYSSPVRITGINAEVPIQVENGEYSLNGSGFSTDAGKVSNNDIVVVRIMTPEQYSKDTVASVKAGVQVSEFKVTTEDEVNTAQECPFDINETTENTVLEIDCVVDLGGASLSLKENISLIYKGGSIVNGVLNLTNGKIDGEFLNQTLSINGTASLSNPVYTLHKGNWGIVENENDEVVAKNNKAAFRKLIKQLSDLNARSLVIENLDAYVFPSHYYIHPVSGNRLSSNDAPFELPSNFTLDMTNNVYIRVYKTDASVHELIRIGNGKNRTGQFGDRYTNVKNVKVLGGNLIGEREDHIYTAEGGTHEWGHLIALWHAEDVTIDGVYMKDATGDGVSIAGYRYTETTDTGSELVPYGSRNITIKNCTFDRIRRNSISLTYAYNTLIEGNHFKNAMVNLPSSNWIPPGLPIDIEPYIFEEVYDAKIINNTHEGKGSFHVYKSTAMPSDYVSPSPYVSPHTIQSGDSGGSIIFEGNVMEGAITNLLGNGVRIRHNDVSYILTGRAAAFDADHQIFDNIVHDNIVNGGKGYEGTTSGILATGRGVKVHSNDIKNVKIGIYIGPGPRSDQLGGLKEASIFGNKIEADQYGISVINGVDGVSILDNDIRLDSSVPGISPVRLAIVNWKDEYKDYKFSLGNNTINGYSGGEEKSYYSSLIRVSGLELHGNEMNGGLSVKDVKNSSINGNEIFSSSLHGLFLQEGILDTEISSNIITIKKKPTASYECVNQKSGTALGSGTVVSNNTCNTLVDTSRASSSLTPKKLLTMARDHEVTSSIGGHTPVWLFDRTFRSSLHGDIVNQDIAGAPETDLLQGTWSSGCQTKRNQTSEYTTVSLYHGAYSFKRQVYLDTSCTYLAGDISLEGVTSFGGTRILGSGQTVATMQGGITSANIVAHDAQWLDAFNDKYRCDNKLLDLGVRLDVSNCSSSLMGNDTPKPSDIYFVEGEQLFFGDKESVGPEGFANTLKPDPYSRHL